MSVFISTYIKPYAKAITAAIVGGVLILLAKGGIQPSTEVTDALTTIVGALVAGGLTWFVPNKAA